MFLLIALCHAIPVLFAGLGSNNRSRTIGTAVVMAAIGLLTGNPAYIATDLVAVGLALAYCLSKNDGDTPNHCPHETSRFERSDKLKTHATSRVNVADAVSIDQHMGLSSAIRLSSIYDQRIRSYGFEPRTLPPDLHATICSSFERRAQEHATTCQMTESDRLEFVQSTIESAAGFLVLCCVGPTEFHNRGGSHADEGIAHLVRTCIRYGQDRSPEKNLLDAVDQAGFMNPEFVQASEVEHARQQKTFEDAANNTAVVRAHERAVKTALRKAEQGAAIDRDFSENAARLATARAAVARARAEGIAIATVRVAPRRQRATALRKAEQGAAIVRDSSDGLQYTCKQRRIDDGTENERSKSSGLPPSPTSGR